MPKSDYEARRQEKLERFQELADKNSKKATDELNQARKMSEVIPFGQPILVGHHSEKRDRNYRNKIDKKYEKSFETRKKSEYYDNRVQSMQNNYAISQDDPEAIKKLKTKLADIETEINQVKKHNKKCNDTIVLSCFQFRQGYQSISNTNGNYKTYATIQDEKLIFEDHTRFPKGVKERIENYMKTKKFNNPELTKENKKFDSYVLENLNGNKSRIKKRIEDLAALNKVEAKEWKNNNITLEINKDENRIMLFFPGKPDEEIRKSLKSHGFRWSPRNLAWQSYINQYNLDFAKTEILKL